MSDFIRLEGAREHNLQNIDLEIPKNSLVVFTGPSGSGKSSLAYDTILAEAQRRFLAAASMRNRSLWGSLKKPDLECIEGLSAAVAVDQKTVVRSLRSTVGTLTELWDKLRFLYSRCGIPFCPRCNRAYEESFGAGLGCPGCKSSISKVEARSFSFNTPHGACPDCRGLGVEDRVDPAKLVANPAKSIRQGALAVTTPTGYLMYSQVTVDVLDRVCRVHGFDVDTPWDELTHEQRRVVLWGSDRIEVPYGKHTLESRLKWKGITARPREEGHYKGIVPVIEQILARSRNDSVLRFVQSRPCSTCGGSRLNEQARNVFYEGLSITEMGQQSIGELLRRFEPAAGRAGSGYDVANHVAAQIAARARMLEGLGLGYLTLDRCSVSLSGGESQRIRLVNQAGVDLRGIIYVLDEPSIGLHPRDNAKLLEMLLGLRDAGNSVLVVEHDPDTMLASDWLVDLGPGAGEGGGRLVFSGPAEQLAGADSSRTAATLFAKKAFCENEEEVLSKPRLVLRGARERNLAGIDVSFYKGALNVVTGVGGAGKTTLVIDVLARSLENGGGGIASKVHGCEKIVGAEDIDEVIVIDSSPIGRTPRSNAATYTKLFDAVRGLFASQVEARRRGWSKSRFSFNTKGGRCEACEGAGAVSVGLMFLGQAQSPCPKCEGRRFDDETLSVRYRGRSIADVLEMCVSQALELFADQTVIIRILEALDSVGLGYLKLGQPASTLSGGEAQRVKLATRLARPSWGRTLFVLDEPTCGLHFDDVAVLGEALRRLAQAGNTVVVVEHDLDFICAADAVVDLGPESGAAGGKVVDAGSPRDVAERWEKTGSHTGRALDKYLSPRRLQGRAAAAPVAPAEDAPIRLRGVRTNNLDSVDVDIPVKKLTVVTGVSGSGKSSLVFDTIFAEGQRCFAESLSSYSRRFLEQVPKPDVEEISGMLPAVAVDQKNEARNPRSTVATASDVHALLRLLFARAGVAWCPSCGIPTKGGRCPRCDFALDGPLTAGMLSFNREQGACPACSGLGKVERCDPEKLVTHPELSIAKGALKGTRTGAFYTKAGDRHLAILEEVGRQHGVDFSVPWQELDAKSRELALYGTGEREYQVLWNFERKGRSGSHELRTLWKGFAGLVQEELERKRSTGVKLGHLLSVMTELSCDVCAGERLAPVPAAVRFANMRLPQVMQLTVDSASAWLESLGHKPVEAVARLRNEIVARLENLCALSLGYLPLDRPTPSLSGGELQRLRIAAAIGSRLTDVLYVLDEPTVGLHPRDTKRLLEAIRKLVDRGNTVLAVEHDREVIRSADWIVELGPKAGEGGGRIVWQGASSARKEKTRPREFVASKYKPNGRKSLVLKGAQRRNLKSIDISLPLGAVTAITGVSGSGKSTWVHEVLVPTVSDKQPRGCESATGVETISRVSCFGPRKMIDSVSSMPATIVGVLDHIRALFAATPEAVAAGFSKKHFSYLSSFGRCPGCKGSGREQLGLGVFDEIWIPCRRCAGRRYNDVALAVRWSGVDIAEIFEMTISSAMELFEDRASIVSKLELLDRLGLGYLKLGQAASTLSGGERMRLSLAAALQDGRRRAERRSSLCVFDEPTRGLGAEDVGRLLDVFDELKAAGDTVVVVEHERDVIASADWVVDLGPEGGDDGGQVVDAGAPADVARRARGHTGRYLAEWLGN